MDFAVSYLISIRKLIDNNKQNKKITINQLIIQYYQNLAMITNKISMNDNTTIVVWIDLCNNIFNDYFIQSILINITKEQFNQLLSYLTDSIINLLLKLSVNSQQNQNYGNNLQLIYSNLIIFMGNNTFEVSILRTLDKVSHFIIQLSYEYSLNFNLFDRLIIHLINHSKNRLKNQTKI